MRDAVENALDDIRPSVRADGGEIELISVENGIVRIRLQGACSNCAGIEMTVAMTIEPMLKERVPGVKAVLSV